MNNKLGSRIRELRVNLDLSQLELAKVLHISNTTLSQYESGSRAPNDNLKVKMSEFFDVSLDYLMGVSNIKKPYIDSNIDLLKLSQSNDPKSLIRNLLRTNIIKNYVGYDLSSLDEEDLNNFTNDLLTQLHLLSYKYKI